MLLLFAAGEKDSSKIVEHSLNKIEEKVEKRKGQGERLMR